MTRHLLIAAALVMPVFPAIAQAAVATGHGALAGRSPHQAYRAGVAPPLCGRTMHSLPSGKLPTYGTHALPALPCADPQIAGAGAGDRRRERAPD